jgi:hypothetical protein
MKLKATVNIGDLGIIEATLEKQKLIIETLMELMNGNSIELEMYRELTDELQRNNKDLNIDAKYKEYYANYDMQGVVAKQCDRYKLIDKLIKSFGDAHE